MASNRAPPSDITRKQFATSVRALDGRALELVISTETPDRCGDSVKMLGWKLDAYAKNPVVLWAHDQSSLPVAKSRRIWVDQGSLKSEPEFASRDLYPFADTVREMLIQGFLNACSVGFRQLKWAWNEERGGGAIDFEEQELLEYSIVPVPANAEALVAAKSAGIDVAPIREWAEKILDGDSSGIWLPRSTIESAWRAMQTKTITASKSLAEDAMTAPVAKAETPASPAPDQMAAMADCLSCCKSILAAVQAQAADVAECKSLATQLLTLAQADAAEDVAEPAEPAPPAPEMPTPADKAALAAIRKDLDGLLAKLTR